MLKLKQVVSSAKRALISTTKIAAVTFITFNYIGGFVICYGPSMEPTLKTRDFLLTEQISPILGRIGIGDVVVARSPADQRSVCKRVVAGPGDVVIFRNKTITVPEESVWLEGDNKDNSNDSRFYGPVPYSMIRRRCVCRLWPDFDIDLDTPSRYYLDSSPTPRERDRHIYNMEKKRLSLEHSQSPPEDDGQKANANTSLLPVLIKINDGEDKNDLFPMMQSALAYSNSHSHPSVAHYDMNRTNN